METNSDDKLMQYLLKEDAGGESSETSGRDDALEMILEASSMPTEGQSKFNHSSSQHTNGHHKRERSSPSPDDSKKTKLFSSEVSSYTLIFLSCLSQSSMEIIQMAQFRESLGFLNSSNQLLLFQILIQLIHFNKNQRLFNPLIYNIPQVDYLNRQVPKDLEKTVLLAMPIRLKHTMFLIQ